MNNSASRPLGLWSATALVIGNVVGSGVFLLPSSLAPFGATSVVAWLIGLCGVLLLAATFARLAMRWPHTGGPYVYAREGFGPAVGFLIAWSYWISIWSGMASIAVAFAGSMSALSPVVAASPMLALGCALAALWACVTINLLGLREAGRTQIVLTSLKLVPLLLFGVIAIWRIDAVQFHPFNPTPQPALSAIHGAMALCLWALIGFESATVPADAIHHPERTIPRATVLGMLLAGIATVLACTAVLGVLPANTLADSTAPMADAAASLWGPRAGVALAVVMAISCFGALNGWVLLSGQVPLAVARDGMFPFAFARTNAGGTPRFGLLVSASLATALVIANYSRSLVALFTFSILLATAAALLPYVVGAAAWLRRGDAHGRITAALGLIFAMYALIGIGREALLWGAGLLLAGVPVYAWQRYSSSRGS